MNKNTTLSILIGVILAAALAGTLSCAGNLDMPWCAVFSGAVNPESPANENAPDDQKEPAIVVFSPRPNEEVGIPIVLTGEARVFENSFAWRLKNEDESILIEGHGTALAPDIGQFGPYEVRINYPEPKSSKGTLEVFEFSAKDGSEINKIITPLRFKAVETANIKVYFNKEGSAECENTSAAERRIAKTQAPARAALEELLKGPTPQEFQQGFRTSINSGVAIQKLAIVNGAAEIDFSDLLQAGVAGSCSVQAIRAQIINTLRQFASVKKVTISINGEVEGILQP